MTQHYGIGVSAILISCVMEMCCEQMYLVSQAFLFLKLRVSYLKKISHYIHDSVGFILFEFLFATGFRGYIFSFNENHYFRGIVVT